MMIIHESAGKCEGRRVFLKQKFPLVVHRVRQTENHSALKFKNHSAVIGDSRDQTEWLSYIHTGTLASNESGMSASASLHAFLCRESVGGWMEERAGSEGCLCWKVEGVREENTF